MLVLCSSSCLVVELLTFSSVNFEHEHEHEDENEEEPVGLEDHGSVPQMT